MFLKRNFFFAHPLDLNSDQSLYTHIKLSLSMTTNLYAVLADTGKERVLRLPEM